MPTMQTSLNRSCGGRLVSVEGADLPLKTVSLRAQAQGGVAGVTLTQTFRNEDTHPLKVTYTLPLPVDAAVAGYRVRMGDLVIRGRVDERKAARDQFEQALVEGRTASLLDQERSNVFTQQLGNVPPGTDVTVELTLHQRLCWLEGGMWEWRFPTVTAPRYLSTPGRVTDAREMTVDVADAALGVTASATLEIGDPLAPGAAVESPSHAIERTGAEVRLAGQGVRLDRDIVVRWSAASRATGIALRRARPAQGTPLGAHAFGLLSLVPPAEPAQVVPRDLIFLIDTSGSMSGRPLDAARRVVGALIDSLEETDRLEMIAFSETARRWSRGPAAATARNREKARRWVEELRAGGGTEMTSGVMEALRPLREGAVRQVVLVTDGQIGFESEVVRSVRDNLPSGSRLHAVGVGSAVNRALTGPAARAGRGVEIVIDLDEDPGRGALRVVAATRAPVAVDLQVAGSAVDGLAPRRPADLMAGAPVLIGVRLSPEGGDLVVRGRTTSGVWEQRMTVPPTEADTGDPIVTTLYGREAVADLETDLAAGAGQRDIDAAVTAIGLQFGLATRLTSWVAVSEEPTVDPRQPVRLVPIPQELPYGMSAEGLGLRSARDRMAMELLRTCALSPDARAGESLSGTLALTSFEQRMVRGTGRMPWAARELGGRWVPGRGDRRVLEFEVIGEPLEWLPGIDVVLELAGGGEAPAHIDLSASTAPGWIMPGLQIRVVLEPLDVTLPAVAAVRLRCGGEELRITL